MLLVNVVSVVALEVATHIRKRDRCRGIVRRPVIQQA